MEDMDKLFDFPDPVIEELDDEEEIRKEEVYMKNRVARHCSDCGWTGGLLNPDQRLCPVCGSGPIHKGPGVRMKTKEEPKRPIIQHYEENDVVTDME
jgi:hypothetical protein